MREAWLGLRFLAWLLAARAGLAVLGFQRTRGLLRPPRRDRPDPRRERWLVERAPRWERRLRGVGTCLSRSLALWRLLVAEGVPCALRIGTRRTPAGEFQAHAWVEHEGRPLNSGRRVWQKYAVFAEDLSR